MMVSARILPKRDLLYLPSDNWGQYTDFLSQHPETRTLLMRVLSFVRANKTRGYQ